MRRLLTTTLLIAGFGLGAAVSYFNWTPVSFNYLAGEAELPLIALLLSAFLLGILVMGLLNLARVWSLQRESRKLTTRLTLAETELKNLRNIDLAGSAARPGPLATTAGTTPAKNA